MDDYELDQIFPSSLQISEDIKRLIDRGESAVEEVLSQPVTFRLFRSSESTIVRYFVENIDKLLWLTFQEDASKKELSAKAFAILEHMQKDLTKELLNHQKLHKYALEVIQKTTVENMFMLNRLMALTLAVLYFDPVAVTQSCGFLLQLIQLLHDPTVLNLFEVLCSDNEENGYVQEWLIKMGFVEIVLNEIDSFTETKLTNTSRLSSEANQIYGLFKIVCICGSSPILGPKFSNFHFVNILNLKVGCFPDFVEHQRWEAITALYNEKTKEMMRGLFPFASEIIQDPKLSITRSGVASLELLALMILLDDALLDFFISMDISNIVINLVISNPGHTHLLFSALDYFKYSFQKKKMLIALFDTLPDIISVHFKSPNHCLRYFMYKLFKVFVKSIKSHSKILSKMKNNKTINELLKSDIPNYKHALRCQYGNYFNRFEHDDAQKLAKKTIQNLGL